jgi:hypothetical protein
MGLLTDRLEERPDGWPIVANAGEFHATLRAAVIPLWGRSVIRLRASCARASIICGALPMIAACYRKIVMPDRSAASRMGASSVARVNPCREARPTSAALVRQTPTQGQSRHLAPPIVDVIAGCPAFGVGSGAGAERAHLGNDTAVGKSRKPGMPLKQA